MLMLFLLSCARVSLCENGGKELVVWGDLLPHPVTMMRHNGTLLYMRELCGFLRQHSPFCLFLLAKPKSRH